MDNRATPKYYGEFRDKVLAGQIPVCREISQEMNRIDALIADPDVYYNPYVVEGFVAFCNNELTLTDGSPMRLLPSFKLWAEQLLGWYIYVEHEVFVPDGSGGGAYHKIIKVQRLVNKQYLIVARGSAKSMYAAAIHAYFLVADRSTTSQITTAPTMKQGDEVLAPIRTAIVRARGPVFQFLTSGRIKTEGLGTASRQILVPTKRGIEHFLTNSLVEIRPMGIDKLQGLRPKVSTVDEWLSGDTREDVVGAIEQGASKLDDYVIVAISSEGTVRNGAGDTIKLELAKILKGDFTAPNVSVWHYKLDDVEEVGDPSKWEKAAPNIGKTVSYEVYHRDVKRAEEVPSTRNDILAKRFGLPMEGLTYFFTYEETVPFPEKDFSGIPCALGADLSLGDDFCAFTFLHVISPDRFGVVTRCYVTDYSLMKLSGALRAKYEEFIREGSLVIFDGTTLDLTLVYDDLELFIEQSELDIRCMGYDPYNAKEFVARYESMNGPYGIEKVIQGARTESVPLGNLKHLASRRRLEFYQSLMSFAMGNAITIEDTNGNRKLSKKRTSEKIDPVAALMDAYVAYNLHKEAFD